MRFPLIPALLLLLPLGRLDAQERLGYDLREGDVFLVEQRAKQEISQKADDTVHILTNQISAVLQFRVLEKKDTTFLLEFSFRDFFFSIESNLQGELLDIRAQEPDEADPRSRVYHSLLNQPVTMELGRRGNILKVDGGDTLVGKMMASTGLEEGLPRAAMRQQLLQEYGSEALASSYEQLTFFYPGKPVHPGERWRNKYTGDLQATNSWLLERVAQGHAVITGESIITLKGSDSAGRMDLRGTGQTRVVTDAGSGFIREMVVRSDAEGITLVEDPARPAIPTRVHTQITYTLIDHRHVQ